EGAELYAVRAVGVGLEDLGARPDVLFVHLEHDLRREEIQLVVALVDEDALRIEHGAHGSVEEVDVLVGDGGYEVVHKRMSFSSRLAKRGVNGAAAPGDRVSRDAPLIPRFA